MTFDLYNTFTIHKLDRLTNNRKVNKVKIPKL